MKGLTVPMPHFTKGNDKCIMVRGVGSYQGGG